MTGSSDDEAAGQVRLAEADLVLMEMRARTAATYEEHIWVGRDSRALIAEVRALLDERDQLLTRAASATVLPERWRDLLKERDGIRVLLTLAKAQYALATTRAEEAEAEVERLKVQAAALEAEWGVRYPGWYQGETDPIDFCDDRSDAEQLAASQPGVPTEVVQREVTPWRPAEQQRQDGEEGP